MKENNNLSQMQEAANERLKVKVNEIATALFTNSILFCLSTRLTAQGFIPLNILSYSIHSPAAVNAAI